MVGLPESGRRTDVPESAAEETGVEGTSRMLVALVARCLYRTGAALEALEFTVGFDGHHGGYVACMPLVNTREYYQFPFVC